MIDSKIAFCFIVKDGEKYLDRNIKRIINLGEKCKDYKIFYAENDSQDKTIEILESFQHTTDRIGGISITLDGKHSTELCRNFESYNCKSRVQRIAYMRNRVLNLAKQWQECDFLIMLDLDFVDFDNKAFFQMFDIIHKNNAINGIFGMSVTERNTSCLYDIGAIRPYYKVIDIFFQKTLVPVSSAFSGFGIYRMKSIIDKEYNEKTNSIEHVEFNKQIKNLYVYSKFRPIYEGNPSTFTYGIILVLFIIIYIISKLISKLLKKPK
jgi:hypothetical protein